MDKASDGRGHVEGRKEQHRCPRPARDRGVQGPPREESQAAVQNVLQGATIRVAGDTHNNAFWAPTLGRYVGITRTWGSGRRQVARTTSKDFLKWTPAKVVLQGEDRNLQTYAMPTFFHGGVYLGLVMVHNQKADRVHCELAWSADTVKWHRVQEGTPLIANATKKGAYDWGCAYAAAVPVFLPNEIRLYYGGSDGLHTGWRKGYFCLATLRPDGFAGYEPTDDDTKAVITTRKGGKLSAGRKVVLQFHLHKAKLYSFSFAR